MVQHQVNWETLNLVTGGKPQTFKRGDILPPTDNADELAQRGIFQVGGAITPVETAYSQEEYAAALATVPPVAAKPAPPAPPAPRPAVTAQTGPATAAATVTHPAAASQPEPPPKRGPGRPPKNPPAPEARNTP